MFELSSLLNIVRTTENCFDTDVWRSNIDRLQLYLNLRINLCSKCFKGWLITQQLNLRNEAFLHGFIKNRLFISDQI